MKDFTFADAWGSNCEGWGNSTPPVTPSQSVYSNNSHSHIYSSGGNTTGGTGGGGSSGGGLYPQFSRDVMGGARSKSKDFETLAGIVYIQPMDTPYQCTLSMHPINTRYVALCICRYLYVALCMSLSLCRPLYVVFSSSLSLCRSNHVVVFSLYDRGKQIDSKCEEEAERH